MICQNCQAKLPENKVVCPECGRLNPYNVQGHSNTKEIQTSLSRMIAEQCGSIADTTQFIAIMFDYLSGCDAETLLLKKALESGALDTIINSDNKKSAFISIRSKLMHELAFQREDAEFVLACFGYMLGLKYVSALRIIEKPDDRNAKIEVSTISASIKPKLFGKIDAFRYALSGKAIVKSGFTELAGYCFENYGKMKEVQLPSTLTAIGEYAFSDCKKLETIDIPDSVRKIDKGAFNACVSLKDVALPKELAVIGDNCFFCCTSLKSLVLPDNVSSIGENAFSGCTSLESIAISKNVKFIDDNAFAYCGKLTVICTENSFVHKYCIGNKIKCKAYPASKSLNIYMEEYTDGT